MNDDRQNLEDQLHRSEKEIDDLRYALDQSSIIAFTDAAGKITYVNDKFCQISKYSRDELLGQNHRIINSGHHPKDFFVQLWKTIAAGRVWTGEIRNRAKDGTHYWVFTTIVPFLAAKGRPFQYVAIRTDITEFKRSQEEAENQRIALINAERMASLGELAAGIAHELGTPLGTIRGRAEFLEMMIQSGKATQEETLKTIDTIKLVADRMTSIIRGMKALSRDGTQDPFQKTSVGSLIKDVLGFSWEGFQRRGIKVHIAEIDERIQIDCQETQIGQVLVNLINNAKDAVSDLEDKWIKIDVLDRGSKIEIAITDSGKGISDELREKIMLPFYTTKPTGKGSGLGLSISATIIENHGGALRLDPDSPNTRFVVTLPKKRAI